MTNEQLHTIKNWLKTYSAPFLGDDSTRFAVRLKIDHIERVVEEARYLATELQLNESDTNIALASAWLHDAGRFLQIKKYHTMSDPQSENHAHLSITAINEEQVLVNLPENEKTLLETAVRVHNQKTLGIGNGFDERTLFFCKLLRDADKLDIWKVILDTDLNGTEEERDTIFHSLDRSDRISEPVLDCIRNGQIVDLRDLRTRHDFRLMVMAWIFDLNFEASVKRVHERGYLNEMRALLPESTELAPILDKIASM